MIERSVTTAHRKPLRNNYGGALRRLKAITEKLESLDFAETPGHVISSLKREEFIALNSTLLHELYFASLSGSGDGKPTAMLAEILARDFRSVDRWRDEFVATANGLAGGSGWVLLVYVPRDRRLINQCAADHSQTLAGSIPILALDMYEHAYHIDFGANAQAYMDAFIRNIDWNAVQVRFEDASKVEPPRPLVQKVFEDVPGIARGTESDTGGGQAGPNHRCSSEALLFTATGHRGRRRLSDPDHVQDWAGELSKSEPVVVFCAYGFHVGCKTALREARFDAKYMKGGHSAWKALGGS